MLRTAFSSNDNWFRQLFELSPDPTWIIEDNQFVECNDAAVSALGYASREEFLNVHPSKLSPLVQPDGEDSYGKAERMMAIAKDQGLHRFEWMHTRANGMNFVAEVTLSAIELQDRHVIYCVWRDITERKLTEEKVHQLAFYDALTKLANRHLLGNRLSQTIATNKRNGCYGAMMFLDLDNFKLLNDTQGHDTGDLLLIEVADRLKNCVREMDTLARFGGDEFVVMIAELDPDRSESTRRAFAIAEKIRTALAKPYALMIRREGDLPSTVEHQCTASIGVVLFGKDETTRESILKWADTAMYRAKEAGRNRVRFHDSID